MYSTSVITTVKKCVMYPTLRYTRTTLLQQACNSKNLASTQVGTYMYNQKTIWKGVYISVQPNTMWKMTIWKDAMCLYVNRTIHKRWQFEKMRCAGMWIERYINIYCCRYRLNLFFFSYQFYNASWRFYDINTQTYIAINETKISKALFSTWIP